MVGAHNFFSDNILKGIFGEKEIYEYILRNNECLENITNYKILEYSAPNGVHPQPITTKVLEKLGMLCYYYTGDNGSSPNRTFINGKMLSHKVIAFPISSFGKYASFLKMKKGGKTEDEVKRWLFSIVYYVVKNRTLRLIYSHPYDIPLYPNALREFWDYVNTLKNKGIIQVKPMSYFATLLLRFLNTKYSINFSNKRITIVNKEGLEGITLALPKDFVIKDLPYGVTLKEEEGYQYITITKAFSANKLDIFFN
jgi:hypothetical protein